MPSADRVYAWIEVDPDGNDRVIAAETDREDAEILRPIAEMHRRRKGRPVRLVEFVRSRVLVELP